MKNKPLVTVITPTYNRADLIKETIESVLAQTYTNFEYLIIDDGSFDNTEEVVKPYLLDNRVRYFKFPNEGEAAAVNRGWHLAGGDYFLQINSDDLLMSDCLQESVLVLEKNKNCVLSYPDFSIVSFEGKIKSTIRSPEWNPLKALTSFSCHAATPGTMIRRSSFQTWQKLRDSSFLYINDVEMYWNMALIGNFMHIPKILAKWREHEGGISSLRYEAVDEIKVWYNQYFSKNCFSADIKSKTKKAIDEYVWELLEQHITDDKYKEILRRYYESEFFNLQIGDNDLVGNKFNGHDLHIYLRRKKIYSDHFVLNKQSSDENTYVIKSQENINCDSIFYHSSFLWADVVHLHLIHNNVIDVDLLPIITKLKPTVWSIHDPWALGGHCIYHFDCEKWKTHCCNCPHLNKPFAIQYDDTALRFELKKQAVQNSQISAIVASKWMENKIKQSPIWAGKKVYRVPFGINQDLFKPIDLREAKRRLGINPDDFVLFFRADMSPYKGIDILKDTLKKVKFRKKITVFTVGNKGLLEEFSREYHIIEFGWLNNDEKLVELYQACDIFLMPSKQEAFGMMAIEAMSCGKLVAAVNGTALPEIINAPECGIAVHENDYPAEIQRLLNNPEEIIERGKKSLEYAKQNYNKDVYVERIIAVYEDVTKSHKLDDAAKHILEQLGLHRPPEKKLLLWYRYGLRPLLGLIFPKYKVKFEYDPKFTKK